MPSDKILQQAASSRNINIRRVPLEVWERARLNAIKSHLPFRDYCIRTLAESLVFTAEEIPAEQAAESPDPTDDAMTPTHPRR